MKDETVRRVYLGGALVSTARPESSFSDRVPALQVENVGVSYGKALALQDVSLHVHEGEFVSLVGLNGSARRPCSTPFPAVPYSGAIKWEDRALSGGTAAQIARSGIVQCPETRELFGDMSVRENPISAVMRWTTGNARSVSTGCSNCSRS